MRHTAPVPSPIYPDNIPEILEPPDESAIRAIGDQLLAAAGPDSAAGLPGAFHPPTRVLPVEEAAVAAHVGEQARLYAWAVAGAATLAAVRTGLATQLDRINADHTTAIATQENRRADVDDARSRLQLLNLLGAHDTVRTTTWAMILIATVGAGYMNKATFQRLAVEGPRAAAVLSIIAEGFVVATASLGGRNAAEYIHGRAPARERRARAGWALVQLGLALIVAAFLGITRWQLSEHPEGVAPLTGAGLYLGLQLAAAFVATGHAYVLGHPQVTALRGAQSDLKDAQADMEALDEHLIETLEQIEILAAYDPYATAAACADAGAHYLLQQAKLGRAERERFLASDEARMVLAALPDPEFPIRRFAALTTGTAATPPPPAATWHGGNGKAWTLVI